MTACDEKPANGVLAFDPTERFLVWVSSQPGSESVHAYELATQRELPAQSQNGRTAQAVVFSADGSLLAVAWSGGPLSILRTADGSLVRTFAKVDTSVVIFDRQVSRVAWFEGNGAQIVVGDLRTGRTLDIPIPLPHSQNRLVSEAACFATFDGAQIATRHASGDISSTATFRTTTGRLDHLRNRTAGFFLEENARLASLCSRSRERCETVNSSVGVMPVGVMTKLGAVLRTDSGLVLVDERTARVLRLQASAKARLYLTASETHLAAAEDSSWKEDSGASGI